MRPSFAAAQKGHEFSLPYSLRHDPKAKPDIRGVGDHLPVDEPSARGRVARPNRVPWFRIRESAIFSLA
jgi:hypothetical protein